MTEPNRIDPERLAALIDGKLGEDEAAAVRRELAQADDDTLAAFADAAAVTAEMEAVDGLSTPEAPGRLASPTTGAVDESRVLPMRSPRRGRRWIPATWAAIAAAAAIGSIIVFRPSKPPYHPAAFVDAIPPGASAPPVPWSVTRGGADGLSDRARAVRVGALLTDVELDVRNGVSPRSHAATLGALLDAVSLAGPAAAAWRGIAEDTAAPPSRERLDGLARTTLDFVDNDLVGAGAYLEAARAATAAANTSFFDKVSDAPLDAAYRNSGLDANARKAIADFRAFLHRQPLQAAALSVAARDLLRLLAE